MTATVTPISPGDERPDKDGRFTSNAELCPTLVAEVKSVRANFGRVRVIKLEPQQRDEAIRSVHRDDNNRFNPDDEGWFVRSWLELTDYPTFDIETVNQTFMEWEHHKAENIMGFRDNAYRSIMTGEMSPVHHTPWLEAMDDSMASYLGNT